MIDPASVPLLCLEIARLQRRFEVLSFTATEAISQPFLFEIEIIGDGFYLDLTSIMYLPAFLNFGNKHGTHGQIQAATRKHYQSGPECYTVRLGPRLNCLGLRHNSRLFQHMSAVRIITQVMEEHGLKKSFRFDLRTDCHERESCVQYQESDLQLVQRLCAEENIHYLFIHSRRRHELIFGTGLHGFQRSPIAPWRQFAGQSGVTRFAVTDAHSAVPGSRAGQHATGRSTLPFVSCGQLLPLAGHPEKRWNRLWLISGVRHRFTATEGGAERYLNRFEAIPWEAGFSTPAPLPRHPIAPLQQGWIVGTRDEPTRPDTSGRVPVHLEWCSQPASKPDSCCWLHLAPGLSLECRGGMAVLIGFPDDDRTPPQIIGYLPEQALEVPVEATSESIDNLHMHLDWPLTSGTELQLGDGPTVYLDEGSSLTVDTGASHVHINHDGMTLSSPRISFTSKTNDIESDPEASQ
ncbi:Rhs element Vgr protein [Pseudomonas coronafaciens pv. coronafaciens]|uniref:type VI secretion system Vgr family protein n=1 Tax=Pseudomonas coronafaciens TaxID=53409 RepID=UPI000F0031C7|nr:contractile injection system protein, VgrG/Pvc8 family [Pseudomonas coronafaciens]RMS11503.1 Rhs element Vgr protein [Pseudomonas coronafaciens pv. coronafaciens]